MVKTNGSSEGLSYISKVSDAVHKVCLTLDREALSRLVVDIIVDTMGISRNFCALYIKEENGYRLQCYRAPFKPPEFASIEMIRNLQLQRIAEVDNVPLFAGEICKHDFLILVPLSLRDRLNGFVAVCAAERIEPESPQYEMLTTFGAICAMGIEVIRLYEELAAKMKEIDLMQKRLVENERLIVMQRLVAGITHEIKNSLTAAYSIAQLLEPGQPWDKELAGKMLNALRRTRDQVSGLLDYAKPKEPKPGSVNLARLLEQTLGLIQYDLRKKDIQLFKKYGKGVEAYADPSQIQQVFLNLLLNAADAVERGGSIHLSTAGPEGDEVHAVVADNGSGILQEHKNRLFEPFFTTKKDGTGLGLFTCYNIVKKNGGEILVESEAGKGTVFSVSLPAAY